MAASDEPHAPLGAGGPAPVGRPGPSWTGDGSLRPRARPRVPAMLGARRVRVAPAGAVLGSVWTRLLGFAVDFAIQFVLLLVIAAFLLRGVDVNSQNTADLALAQGSFLRLAIAQTLLRLGYNGYFNVRGWSPGKRVVGLRIVRQDGTPPTLRVGLVRTVVAELSAIFWLGYLWAVLDAQTQTWHDKLAGTWVVRVQHEDKLGK